MAVCRQTANQDAIVPEGGVGAFLSKADGAEISAAGGRCGLQALEQELKVVVYLLILAQVLALVRLPHVAYYGVEL